MTLKLIERGENLIQNGIQGVRKNATLRVDQKQRFNLFNICFLL